MNKSFKILLTIFAFSIITFAFVLPLNPPGWYQQTLPVNDQINDIYFINSQTGWIVTNGSSQTNDTSYIMKTTDGGTSWVIQKTKSEELNAIQFLDANTGYAGGGGVFSSFASFYKTTNGGTNWFNLNNLSGTRVNDIAFVSKDTGWVSFEGGLTSFILKTNNGGNNWSQQYTQSEHLGKLFMLNKDTGWFTTQSANGQLYRTTNGGNNWGLQYTFTQQINDVNFLNPLKGIITSGFNYFTTNGGFNWTISNDGGIKISMINDTIGWAGSNFNRIMKTTNGGLNWFRQYSPIFDNSSVFALTINNAWAGGTGLVYTTDGGGPPLGIELINTEIPENYILLQSYPNPFNPITNIKYSVKRQKSNVKLIVYDITGKEIIKLVDKQQIAGTYKVDWNAVGYSSGIYFYSLIIDGILTETKKMILIK